MKTITERISIDYELATTRNPSGIASLTIGGMVYTPPTYYRTFQTVADSDEYPPFVDVIKAVRDRVMGTVLEKTGPVPEGETFDVTILCFTCMHLTARIVAGNGSPIVDEKISSARAAGALHLPQYDPHIFEIGLTDDELARLVTALAPIEARVANGCQVLNDRPHYVAPIAVREVEAGESSEGESVH